MIKYILVSKQTESPAAIKADIEPVMVGPVKKLYPKAYPRRQIPAAFASLLLHGNHAVCGSQVSIAYPAAYLGCGVIEV
jgi:hypothetical protein